MINYNDYIITELDHKAYDLYCGQDEDTPYRGVNHTFFDFLLEHDNYLEYYSKAKIEIRKEKLIQLSKKIND